MVRQKALLCLQGCRGVQSLVCHKALLCFQGCRRVQRWVGHRALPRLQCHTGYTAVCATRHFLLPSPLPRPLGSLEKSSCRLWFAESPSRRLWFVESPSCRRRFAEGPRSRRLVR